MAIAQNAPLLITGASGMLGDALCRQTAGQTPVVGVYRRHRPGFEGLTLLQADLCEADLPGRLMDALRPAAVIHTAAAADVTQCEKQPELYEEINVQVPARLAALCARKETPFVFTSTDLVFDGTRPPYAEQDETGPLGIYAGQKVRAEKLVLQNWPGAMVCRLPLMIGAAPFGSMHFCSRMLRAIREDRPLQLFVDEYRTPVDTDSAARGLLQLLGRVHGIFHLGGRTRVSRHTLGLMMADAMGVAPRMIRPVGVDSLKLATPRACDVSLDSRKAYAAGYAPLPLETGVQNVVEYFLNQYDQHRTGRK